ncbi:hypothetical protein SGRI78S_02940 [Streptomyces griseus subsp. griseus]
MVASRSPRPPCPSSEDRRSASARLSERPGRAHSTVAGRPAAPLAPAPPTPAGAATPVAARTAPDRVAPWPTSTNVSYPSRARRSTAAPNSTGRSAWSRRYSGPRTGCHSAVTVLMRGTDGARGVNARAASAIRSATGRISGEWKARETRTRRVGTPRPSRRAAALSTARTPPERTWSPGPLYAATVSAPSDSATAAATASSPPRTAIMAPGSVNASMRRPRSAANDTASRRVSTPLTQAAVSSPTLCPATASGSTPQARNWRESATPEATRSGCACSVASRAAASTSGSSAQSSRERPPTGPRRADASSNVSRNTRAVRYSARSCPGNREPCPGYRKTTRGRERTGLPPRPPASPVPAAETAARRSRRSPWAMTASRWGPSSREVLAVRQTSPSRSSGRLSRWVASRVTASRSAPGLCAERVSR